MREAIYGDKAEISGRFTLAEARPLAGPLEAGPLTAPLESAAETDLRTAAR